MSITLSIILVFLLTLGGSPVQSSGAVCLVHPARSVSVLLNRDKTPGTPERTPDKNINAIPASTTRHAIFFQGRPYDDKVNVYYYRARYYEPIMGRFLQTAPMGYQDSMNLYQGFNMNPVNFVDPMGKEKEFNVMVMGGMSCKDAERLDNDSKDARGTGSSMLADFLPVIGDVKGIIEGVVGKDIMGNKLEWWERGLAILCMSELSHVDDIVKIGGKAGKIADTVNDIDKTTDSMGDVKKMAKNAPIIENAASNKIKKPASVDDLLEMMNMRPGVKAEYATGDAEAYLQYMKAEGSHLIDEALNSHILLRKDISTRHTAIHEWLHRVFQRKNSGKVTPGEDMIIEEFLGRFTNFLKLGEK